LDHKTRASAPDDVSYTLRYYKFQMDVYTLLLERAGHPTSRTAYVVYYYPVEGVLHDGFPFQVAIHEIATDPEGAYRIFSEACRCLSGPLPRAAAACAYCQWARALPVDGAPSAPDTPASSVHALQAFPPGPISASPRAPSRRARRPSSARPDDLFG
jgi:hypothetical protein